MEKENQFIDIDEKSILMILYHYNSDYGRYPKTPSWVLRLVAETSSDRCCKKWDYYCHGGGWGKMNTLYRKSNKINVMIGIL